MPQNNLQDVLDFEDPSIKDLKSNFINNLQEKEEDQEKEENSEEPQELYSTPTVDLSQKAISKDALKKLHHENFVQRFHNPAVKQTLVERFFENEVQAFREKHGYEMSGKQKRSVKRMLSTMYDKGKFNKYLKDSASLN